MGEWQELTKWTSNLIGMTVISRKGPRRGKEQVLVSLSLAWFKWLSPAQALASDHRVFSLTFLIHTTNENDKMLAPSRSCQWSGGSGVKSPPFERPHGSNPSHLTDWLSHFCSAGIVYLIVWSSYITQTQRDNHETLRSTGIQQIVKSSRRLSRTSQYQILQRLLFLTISQHMKHASQQLP